MYIPAQGSGAPSHTAPRSALYYRTSNNTVYIQTAGPTGSTWVLLKPTITPFAESLLDDANAAAARTTLGLGDRATQDDGDDVVGGAIFATGGLSTPFESFSDNGTINDATVIVRINSDMGSSKTVNLPASPRTNHAVMISGAGSKNNVTVGRNGNTIDGAGSDYVLAAGSTHWFIFSGSDWKRVQT